MTGEAIIELEDVDKFFGDFQALHDINLKVGAQEVVVVIGPSGSGKSTMIRCINRLEEHDAGRIVVDGTELSNDIRNIQEIRRETGMVFQSSTCSPTSACSTTSRSRRATCARCPKAKAEALGDGAARPGADPRTGQEVSRVSCRAASSSGWRSPARWRCGRR